MRHLLISREYPPSPGGGIGTYAQSVSHCLARRGEEVHVISQLWENAERPVEEHCSGRLVIHRVPFESWTSFTTRPSEVMEPGPARALFVSDYAPQSFAWSAGLLAERLVLAEGIDVIEAPEYEAPLYYFQLRRALGRGPDHKPPCIVHLHSPTELIARHNDWKLGDPAYLTASRLEGYSIGAADALLCPSRYLASQMEERYHLLPGTIRVVPYPIIECEHVERDEEVWKRGPICYVGRLERRKGVIEWLEAAVRAATDFPEARFEFVGRNVLGSDRLESQQIIDRLVPRRLRNRFLFLGEQPRERIAEILKRARIAVVPSRWDNFPYACMEAMSSGLPVIASPEGGMTEMVADGRSGWIAENARPDGLARALARALETSSAETAQMGACSARTIRQLCDPDDVVDRNLAWRAELVTEGAKRSLRTPASVLSAQREHAAAAELAGTEGSLALVIVRGDGRKKLRECLQSVEEQTCRPELVILVGTAADRGTAQPASGMTQQQSWEYLDLRGRTRAEAKSRALDKVLHHGRRPIGVAFLSESDRLDSHFVSSCEAVLRRFPEVGVVSFWTGEGGSGNRIETACCPQLPFQWIANDAVAASVVRTDALRQVEGFRTFAEDEYESWDLVNAVLLAGWVGVTVPEILAYRKVCSNEKWRAAGPSHRMEVRRRLCDRLPRAYHSSGPEHLLVELFEEYAAQTVGLDAPRYLRHVHLLLSRPVKTARLVLGKVKEVLHRRSLRHKEQSGKRLGHHG